MYRQMNSTFKRTVVGATAVVGVPLSASIMYSYYEYMNTPSNQISIHHTPYSIWIQSLTNLFMSKMGQSSINRFDNACQNASQKNEQLLLDLLDKHKDTMYGIDYNLSSIKSREDFIHTHPITTHEHYEPYISKIMQDGQQQQQNSNVMFPDKIRMIGETSGTSGSRKLIPVPMYQRKVFFIDGIGITFHVLQKGINELYDNDQTDNDDKIVSGTGGISNKNNIRWPNLQKSCKLMIEPQYKYTANGSKIKIGPNSSTPSDNKALLQLYTTPEIAFTSVRNESDLMFIHALYALLDKNLGMIESNFANRVFNFFVIIEEHWDGLIKTIDTGKLPTTNNILSSLSNSVRKEIERNLQSNPTRALELKQIKMNYEKERQHQEYQNNKNSEGTSRSGGEITSLARRMWPTLHTILAVETGSFEIYGKKLRQEWIGDDNDIVVYSPLYAATEGLIGVNTNLRGKSYILNPRAMFFEFIPVLNNSETNEKQNGMQNNDTTVINDNRDDKTHRTLFIEELEVGTEYEVIITNLTGLYRYRFGDVVRCIGYYGETPIVEFAYRKGQFLNVAGERTSEETLYNTLIETITHDWTGLQLKEYTTVDYVAIKPTTIGNNRCRNPRYTIFVELSDTRTGKNDNIDRPLTEKEITALDIRLAKANRMYGVLRAIGRLQCVDVITVQSGTFERIKKEMISSGLAATQFKQPRVTRNEKLVQILEEGQIPQVVVATTSG